MHKLAILAINNVVALDLAIPIEIFNLANFVASKTIYAVRVCGESENVPCREINISGLCPVSELADADTIIVPGSREPGVKYNEAILKMLRAAAHRGARIASICSGAFVLAEAGLLSGLTATAHWKDTELLATMYPDISVDPKPIFIDNGQILTSAGLSAGLDLCLHLVRKDYGQAVAADVARHAVAPLDREGTQAQFIRREAPKSTKELGDLLLWLSKNCADKMTVADIARKANMSERTLSRRFHEQLGTTPLHWLASERIRQAQAMLETTSLSVNEIAFKCGFENPGGLRTRFQQTTGTSPSAYRRIFNKRFASHTTQDEPSFTRVDPKGTGNTATQHSR